MKLNVKNKICLVLICIIFLNQLMPIALKANTGVAPTVTWAQVGGEVLKQVNGKAGTVKVTGTSNDDDAIVYFKYYWDYDRDKTQKEKVIDYSANSLKTTRTTEIEVPQETGLHILTVQVIDQHYTGATAEYHASKWVSMPYYIVDTLSDKKDTTAPVLNKENLVFSGNEIELKQKIKINMEDPESGIYYIAYAWTLTSETTIQGPNGSAYTRVYQPENGTIEITAPDTVGDWTLSIFGANSTYVSEKGVFMMSPRFYYEYKVRDKTAPVLTLNGSSEMQIKEGENFNDPGATFTDNYDATKIIYAYNSNELNNLKRGTYTLKYKTSDQGGNVSNEVTRTVKVVGEKDIVNITAPTKTLYNYGESIDLTGSKIEVIDIYGNSSEVAMTEEMVTNFTTIGQGKHTAIIKYKDAEVSYTYNVQDYVDSLLIKLPSKTIYEYKEQLDLTGATVQRVMASGEKGLEVPVTQDMIQTDFNPNELGVYTVTVNYANSTAKFYVTVKDTTAPVITFEDGKDEVTYSYGETYVEPTVTVKDIYDDDKQNHIELVKTGNVNMNVVGDYVITYTAIDSSFNKAIKTRIVHVVDKKGPVITPNPNNIYQMQVFDEIPTLTAKVLDEYDNEEYEITANTDNINKNKVGMYSVIFTATDKNGNTTTLEPIDFEVTKRTTTINEIQMSNTEAVYNGEAKYVTVEAKDGVIGLGNIKVLYYQNRVKVESPINAGTYEVRVAIEEGENYFALDETTIGTLTIDKAELPEDAITSVNNIKT